MVDSKDKIWILKMSIGTNLLPSFKEQLSSVAK